MYVLLIRIAHEAQAAILRSTQRFVLREREASAFARLIRRLPRRILERAVADPTTPRDTARLFAEYLMHSHAVAVITDARRTSRRKRWRRVRALQVVTRARSHVAVTLLGEALESTDEELVAAAVALLGEIGDLRAAAVLIDALREQSFARSRVAAQLDATSEPVAHLLLPLLREEDAQLRFWAATLLSRYAGHPGVDLELTRAAMDETPSIRAAVVESLAGRKAPAARTTAVALLQDPVWFVRAHAARALRDLEGNTGPAVAPLLADESWWVRAAAKETLEARPGDALETLLGYLEHEDRFARNSAAEVLQNTGVLDTLILDEPRIEPHGSFPATAQRILAAGGRRLAHTAAARNGLDPEYLEQLAATER